MCTFVSETDLTPSLYVLLWLVMWHSVSSTGLWCVFVVMRIWLCLIGGILLDLQGQGLARRQVQRTSLLKVCFFMIIVDIDLHLDLHYEYLLMLNLAVILARQKGSQTLFGIFHIKSGTNITLLFSLRCSFFCKKKEVEVLILLLWPVKESHSGFSLWELQYNLNYKRMCDLSSFCHTIKSRLYLACRFCCYDIIKTRLWSFFHCN